MANETLTQNGFSYKANVTINNEYFPVRSYNNLTLNSGFYDAVIMDPPSYGRGPSGEVWKIEECVDELVTLAAKLLSREPLFFLVNSYTTGLSPSAMNYILELRVRSRFGGVCRADEIGIPVTQTGCVLPAGASARWEL